MAASYRPPRSRPAQPPRITRSGLNKLIRLPMPTPRYSAVFARTASAAGDESAAAMSSASIDSRPPPGATPRPPSRARAASAPPSAPRQPADPHRQRLPSTTTVVWPHSVACETVAWHVPQQEIRDAPTPDPISTTAVFRAPRPAPAHISAWPIVLVPFSTRSGRVVCSRSSRSSGTASHPVRPGVHEGRRGLQEALWVLLDDPRNRDSHP